MNKENHKVSVVVPVYNSQETLKSLITKIKNTLEVCTEAFEIILVNDDSRDGSWEMIKELVESNDGIKAISLMRNYGQHNALLAGIRSAQYEKIVTIDDDLQNPPEEIPKLLEKLDEGYDVVYGTPQSEQHGLCRDVASQITKMALKSVMNVKIARNVSAFRAFRIYLREGFSNYCGTHPSIDVLLTWSTNRFAFVPVKHVPRQKGSSNYTITKLINHAVNMATGYSTLPLRVASILGFVFTLFGFLVLMYVISRYLISGSPVPGFAFLASTVAIFSGVQLFALGIIGEYLARMHLRLMDRPSYTIREKREHGRNEVNSIKSRDYKLKPRD
jgi:glycosyltransferase involved in cell wall biosynthesis